MLAFFAELLVHTQGEYARRPFVPATWQRREVIEPLFGEVVWDERRRRYVRKYDTLYLFTPRKNGKSQLLAAICLYMLVGEGEEGAEVWGLALDRDQASHVYRRAARMCELSPTLSKRLEVLRSTGRIVDASTASFMAVAAGDWAGALGGSPQCAYIDELLTQPSRDLYDALHSGFGTRASPLLMLATTAENDPEGFAAQERMWSEQVLADPELEPGRLVVMYCAPPEADWTKPSTWRAANPALGDFLDMRVIAAECQKAQRDPPAERAFRQYRLNQPQGAVGRAIDLQVWDAAGAKPADDELTSRVCFGGLDLASTSDLASYALAFPDQVGGFDVIWRVFAPESMLTSLDRRTGGRASVWARDKYLTLTEGNVIDYRAIRRALDEDRDKYSILSIGFDRWGATQLSTELEEEGVPLVQTGMGFASMSAPTKELLRLVALGVWRHGGNPLVRWQASNLVTRSDPAGNLKPDKERSVEKIDSIVAGILALDRAMRHVDEPPPRQYAVGGFR